MSQKTRSTLTIDAVATGATALAAQASATGAATVLNPLRKLDAIAGLAGFVLRLFRSREQLPPIACPPSGRARKRPARIREGSGKAVRSQSGSKGGSYH